MAARGDMRLVLNKEAAGDTASLVFQSGYSARAEFGLAGGDDFSVKVSPDGSSFYPALTVSAASGFVGVQRAVRGGGVVPVGRSAAS